MAVQPQTERARLSAEDRRACVLRAARGVFAKHGFRGAGTAEIAAAAGCSEPTLYKHFPSKQALFAAVLDDATAAMRSRMDELLAGTEDPLARLVEVCGKLDDDDLMVEISRLRMLAITLADEPEIRAALERSVAELRRRAVEMVAAMQRAGGYRDDIEAEQVAWLWFGFVLVAGFRLAVEGESALADLSDTPKTLRRLLRTDHREEGPSC
jgi:TetR/AcrR family transcriptional regulator